MSGPAIRNTQTRGFFCLNARTQGLFYLTIFMVWLLLTIHTLFNIVEPATFLIFHHDGDDGMGLRCDKLPQEEANMTAEKTKDTSSSSKDGADAASTTAINQTQVSTSTLVIVQGNLRGGEIPWRTLKERVLDNNPNTDLALMIGKTVDPRYTNSSLFGRAKYIWTFPEYEDWGVPLDETFGTEWRQTIRAPLVNKTNPDHVMRNVMGGIKGTTFGSGAVQFMIRYWLHQRIQELNLVEQYTQFVITRSDHYYLCAQNLSGYDTHEFMYVPKGEDWGGINDRHLVVGKQYVLEALDWFPHVLKYSSRYRLETAYNTEFMLYKFWRLNGLLSRTKRTDRDLFIAMDPDLNDHTRTGPQFIGKKHDLGPEGVRVKYNTEYAQARKEKAC